MRIVNIIKKSQLALLCAAVATLSYQDASAKKKDAAASQKFVHTQAGNPYLPLWEHVPDGEPKVFEDPDNPGKSASLCSLCCILPVWRQLRQ